MFFTRRKFINKSMVLTASAVTLCAFSGSMQVHAESAVIKPFSDKLEQTLKDLFNGSELTETGEIAIQIPKIAENGAVVPVTVTSSLSDVQSIFILVDKNPLPLTAQFDLSPEMEPFVSARLKMAETSAVLVVVKAAGKLYSARETVKVTIGGCGG